MWQEEQVTQESDDWIESCLVHFTAQRSCIMTSSGSGSWSHHFISKMRIPVATSQVILGIK